MTLNASSAGADKPRAPKSDWNPTNKEFKTFVDENKDALVLRDSIPGNAYRIAQKIHLVFGVSPEKSQKIVNKYIDELAATVNERMQGEGERVRVEFLALSKSAPKEIQDLIREARKVNAPWCDQHQEQFDVILGHFGLPSTMQNGKFLEGEKGERGESYLTADRWQKRPSIDGELVRKDHEKLRNIDAVPGSAEQLVLKAIDTNMRALYDMDRENMSFVNSAPSLRPGARFAWSFLLAGIVLYSGLIAWKTKRVPKKGLLALGLLLYLNRNRGSELRMLADGRYETLTKELQGSEEGKNVFQALGQSGNRTALKEFAAREKKRQSLPANQREGLPSSDESYALLTEELGFTPESVGGKKLRSMPVADIYELSKSLQRFSDEEMEIAMQFVRRKIDVPEAIASVPLQNPATAQNADPATPAVGI